MAALEFDVAKRLAASLITIGHPFAADAVEATAFDLIEWCKGAVINGRVWTPEDQASSIVQEARTEWPDGWPDKGGTRQLRQAFRSRFPQPEKPLTSGDEMSSAQRRGLLAPPCKLCPADATFCEYGGYLGHQHEQGWLPGSEWKPPARAAASGSALPRAELERLLQNAEANYRDEQRRKHEQLKTAGVD